MIPKLEAKGIKDGVVQDNFVSLKDFYAADPFSRGEFKFFEFVIPTNNVTLTYPYTLIQPHNLGFLPRDVIQLHNRNNVTVTWLFNDFTDTILKVQVSGATTLRALIGRYNG